MEPGIKPNPTVEVSRADNLYNCFQSDAGQGQQLLSLSEGDGSTGPVQCVLWILLFTVQLILVLVFNISFAFTKF